jgi:hypothetical protein
VVVSGELHLILTGTEVYILVLLTQYRAGDKIKKNEVGGACSTYGGDVRNTQGCFGGKA